MLWSVYGMAKINIHWTHVTPKTHRFVHHEGSHMGRCNDENTTYASLPQTTPEPDCWSPNGWKGDRPVTKHEKQSQRFLSSSQLRFPIWVYWYVLKYTYYILYKLLCFPSFCASLLCLNAIVNAIDVCILGYVGSSLLSIPHRRAVLIAWGPWTPSDPVGLETLKSLKLCECPQGASRIMLRYQ